MNGSAIRTGACFQWNENPRTSALRDICTAASPGTPLMSVVPLDHQRAAHILIPSFWAARRRSFPHERIFPRSVANTPRLAAGRAYDRGGLARLSRHGLARPGGGVLGRHHLPCDRTEHPRGNAERSRLPHHRNCCGRGPRWYLRFGGATVSATPCSDTTSLGVL